MDSSPPPASTTGQANTPRPRLVCFVNGIFGEGIGGGDVYFYFIARAALAAGYPIHFFGGHALKRYLGKNQLPMNLTLTDSGMGRLGFLWQEADDVLPRVAALPNLEIQGLCSHFAAVEPDAFHAAVAALVVFGLAGEWAAQHAQHPGSYGIALLDGLDAVTPDSVRAGAKFTESP